jgi:hypothetical protein
MTLARPSRSPTRPSCQWCQKFGHTYANGCVGAGHAPGTSGTSSPADARCGGSPLEVPELCWFHRRPLTMIGLSVVGG